MANLKYNIKNISVLGLINSDGELDKYKIGNIKVDLEFGDILETETDVPSYKIQKSTLDKLSEVVMDIQKELELL